MPTAKKEVAKAEVVETGDGAALALLPGSALDTLFRPIVDQLGTDRDLITLQILEGLAGAESAAALFSESPGTSSWREYLGVPFQVNGVHWNPSDYPGGLVLYAMVDAVNMETGESITLQTGASQPVVQLRQAEVNGYLPANVCMINVRPERGNPVYKLVAVEPF